MVLDLLLQVHVNIQDEMKIYGNLFFSFCSAFMISIGVRDCVALPGIPFLSPAGMDSENDAGGGEAGREAGRGEGDAGEEPVSDTARSGEA